MLRFKLLDLPSVFREKFEIIIRIILLLGHLRLNLIDYQKLI